MVRARFAYSALGAAFALVGLCDAASDGTDLTARTKDHFSGPTPSAGATGNLTYKLGALSLATGTGRAGSILNTSCVAGVLAYTAGWGVHGSEELASGLPTSTATFRPGTGSSGLDPNFEFVSRSNAGVFFGVNSNGGAGNFSAYLAGLRIDLIGDVADATAPVVALVSPAELTNLRRFQPIVVDVTDEAELGFHQLGFIYDDLGIYEVAYDSADPTLATPYVVTSAAIADGYRYTVYRRSGWPSRPRYRVRATDGNVS